MVMGLGVKIKILYIYIIRMSPPIPPNCGFRSVDFSGNDPSGNSSADLVNVFPVTEYHYFQVTSSHTDISNLYGPISLSNNYTNTTDYAVLTSIYQGFNWPSNNEDSGTYDVYGTSQNIKNTVITSKTASQFSYSIYFNNSKNANFYVIFMVIYNINLDFSNNYPNSS